MFLFYSIIDQSKMPNAKSKIKNDQLELDILGFLKKNWIFILLILLAVFLRFYNIGDYLHFANDEVRDAYIVKDIIEQDFFKLIGPATTVGNFNLGPFFYYFLTPFYILFNFNPVAGGVAVALLDLFTIGLLYFFTKKHFSKLAAILATLLYVASFWVNFYERWGWNPNILPFFTMLTLWLGSKLYFSRSRPAWYYMLGLGAVIGLALQAHAQAVWLGVFVIIILILKRGTKSITKLGHGLIFIPTAFLMNLPLLIFEIKTGGQNSRAIINWLMDTREASPLGTRIIQSVTDFANFTSQLVIGEKQLIFFVGLLFLVPSLYLLIIYNNKLKNFWRDTKRKDIFALRSLLLLTGLILFSFLLISEKKYFHFFMILLPVLPIYLGFILAKTFQENGRLLRWLIILLVVSIAGLNVLYTISYWQQLERGDKRGEFDLPLKDIRAASEYMANNSGQTMDVNLTEFPNEDRAFMYFLEKEGAQLISGCGYDFMVTRDLESEGKRFGRIKVVR